MSSESWYDWDDYDGIEIHRTGIWDKRLKIDPIHGFAADSPEDLASFMVLVDCLDNPHMFDEADPYSILYL